MQWLKTASVLTFRVRTSGAAVTVRVAWIPVVKNVGIVRILESGYVQTNVGEEIKNTTVLLSINSERRHGWRVFEEMAGVDAAIGQNGIMHGPKHSSESEN